MVRPMVHSTKHYVQTSLTTVTGGTVLNVIIADAVAVKDKDNVFEVEEGSTIKAIFAEMWIQGSSTVVTSGQVIVSKQISDSSNPTTVEMAALGDWDNKKNIFFTTQGLFPENGTFPFQIIRGWIKIPKGKQRMGLSDRFTMSIFVPVTTAQVCGFFTYKEYS